VKIKSPKHGITQSGHGWYKWLNGKTKYIASLAEAPTGKDADRIFEQRYAELHALGTPVRVSTISLRDVADLFLDDRYEAWQAGRLAERTYNEYREVIDDYATFAGKDKPAQQIAEDTALFGSYRAKLERRYGPSRVQKYMIIVRSMWKWAAAPPIRMPAPNYGNSFTLPSRAEHRKHRRAHRLQHGALMYEPWEIQLMLKYANPSMKAMILLALNGGMGNSDLATLPIGAVDLDKGIIDHPRAKTAIDRRFVLWPETIDAIRVVLKERKDRLRFCAKADEHLLFLTHLGNSYVTIDKDQVGFQFVRLLRKVEKKEGAKLIRNRRNFYSLRRTFRTIADETNDQRAIALIMGHETGDIASLYVQTITDDRLRAVVNFVRARLMTPQAKPVQGEAA
jgi:integrase